MDCNIHILHSNQEVSPEKVNITVWDSSHATHIDPYNFKSKEGETNGKVKKMAQEWETRNNQAENPVLFCDIKHI